MKRSSVTALTTVIFMSVSASPAFAWSNGVDGPNSFGTHDWILKKAIRAAKTEGNWVNLKVALHATDDPDTKDGIDHASATRWHAYDRWGDEYGRADEAARVWFRRIQRRLARGNERSASRALGYLAHIVGDIGQPMHTDQTEREDEVHDSYEYAVDSRSERGDDVYGFTYDGRDSTEPAARIRRLARHGHKTFRELVRAYDQHGYNSNVHRITKRQLKRGANAVADLITSLR